MTGLREVKATLLEIRRYKMLAIFLVGFLIFNDGVMTVISQASVYAQKKFDLTQEQLIPIFLMIQFVALPGRCSWAGSPTRSARRMPCTSAWPSGSSCSSAAF